MFVRNYNISLKTLPSKHDKYIVCHLCVCFITKISTFLVSYFLLKKEVRIFGGEEMGMIHVGFF